MPKSKCRKKKVRGRRVKRVYEKPNNRNSDDNRDDSPAWADLSTRGDRPGPGDFSGSSQRVIDQKRSRYPDWLTFDRAAVLFTWLFPITSFSRRRQWLRRERLIGL